MNTFLELEAGNMTIALFFVLIAVIVATRPFVSKTVKKFLMLATIGIFSFLIIGHYLMTTNRMESVKAAYENGEEVVCENRMNRKAAQGLVISKKLGWSLEGYNFSSPEYNRVFHSARCIAK